MHHDIPGPVAESDRHSDSRDSQQPVGWGDAGCYGHAYHCAMGGIGLFQGNPQPALT